MANSLQPDHLPVTKSKFASKVTALEPLETEVLVVLVEEKHERDSWWDDACTPDRPKR